MYEIILANKAKDVVLNIVFVATKYDISSIDNRIIITIDNIKKGFTELITKILRYVSINKAVIKNKYVVSLNKYFFCIIIPQK